MVPILFPQTYLNPVEWNFLRGLFPSIGMLRIGSRDVPAHLLQAERDGDAVLQVVSGDDDDRVLRQKSQFREWLQMNAGADRHLLALQEDRIPFFDDASIAGIGKAIRDGMLPKATASPPDDMFRAKLFLSMAEDRQMADMEVSGEMVDLAARERVLFRQLHGTETADARFSPDGAGPAEDPCARMPAVWISSWCRLALKEKMDPSALVMTSPAALEWLGEKVGAPVPWCRLDADLLRADAGIRDAFRSGLAELADADAVPVAEELAAAGASRPAVLSVSRILDRSPRECFRIMAADPGDPGPHRSGGSVRHTVIVFVAGVYCK